MRWGAERVFKDGWQVQMRTQHSDEAGTGRGDGNLHGHLTEERRQNLQMEGCRMARPAWLNVVYFTEICNTGEKTFRANDELVFCVDFKGSAHLQGELANGVIGWWVWAPRAGRVLSPD